MTPPPYRVDRRLAPAALEPERGSRAQLLLWGVALYLAYAAFCFTGESYARKQFGIRRQAEVDAIKDRRTYLHESVRRSTSLSEMESSPLYGAYATTCAVIMFGAGIAAGVAVFRARRRRGVLSAVGTAKMVVLASFLALLLGLVPPVAAIELWDQYSVFGYAVR